MAQTRTHDELVMENLELQECLQRTSRTLSSVTQELKNLEQRIRQRDEASASRSNRRCSVCLQPQFHTYGGWTCKNGHGGADPLWGMT